MANADLKDKTLTCGDCKAEFVWTAGEQQFFSEKAWTAPKRCKPCRQLRKQERPKQDGQRS